MVANHAKRSGLNVFKLWMTDTGTFPVVLIASFAAVAASAVSMRYLYANPDVYFNKESRTSELHHEDDRGAAWRQFRFRMANLQKNPINQSRQFDKMFEKEENKDIRR